MQKPTREYCLSKIAELEKQFHPCGEEAPPDFVVMLECWRWLEERARQREAGADDDVRGQASR